MKNKFIVAVLCICVLFLLAGCGAGTEEHDYYEELIAAARECVINNDEEVSEAYDFSTAIYMNREYEILGYMIEDIDGNGTDELILGENAAKPDSTWDGIIYDIYTISDGELVHVLDGWERNRYYFCENGMIANEASGGAGYSAYTYFTFDGTELYLVESVIYDGWRDETNPWFYSTETYDDTENAEPISEEQALAIMKKYVYEYPTFIPFAEDN